ncbi:PIGU family protein [Megaselia abdita]
MSELKSIVLITCISFTIRFLAFSMKLREKMPAFTSVNSIKMSNEGIFLQEHNIDPYSGRLVHSMPITLMFEKLLATQLLKNVIFAILDSLTGILLFYGSKHYLVWKAKADSEIKKKFSSTVFENLDIVAKDLISIPKCVILFYSLNPILIVTSSNDNILCNFFYALTFYSLNSKKTTLALLSITFLFLDSIYAIVLLSPILVSMSGDKFKKIQKSILLVVFIGAFILINYGIFGSWSFIEGTIGFSIQSKNLQPNVGLYWYFFTEMFDHFRFLFLSSFQINATILYIVPLTLRLKRDPTILFIVLLGIITVFKPYPKIPEFCIVLSVLPIFKTFKKYMVHDFVVFSFFMISLSLLPSLWYLWIHTGAANANFFFGATLAFCTGQVFFVSTIAIPQFLNHFNIFRYS